MCGTADSLMVTQYVWYSRLFNGDTVCSDANGSVHNESATVQFISAIYCLCVLTEQHSGRRNSKYRQQTETDRQQVITNSTLKRTAQTVLNCNREICESIVCLVKTECCWVELNCLVHNECCGVELKCLVHTECCGVELNCLVHTECCCVELNCLVHNECCCVELNCLVYTECC